MPVHTGMKKILINRREFVRQLRIEQPDDIGITFHGGL
jgi:hypothetical protein